MTAKSPLQHDQVSGVNENQHHNKIHDLSSLNDHSGKLDEARISYRNPPLHTHKFDIVSGKIKVKKEGQAETKAHSLIEFRGSGIEISENAQYDKIIVEIDNSVVDVPAGTPEYYVLSSTGSPSTSTATWDEPHVKQSLSGILIGTRPEINFYASGSYLSIFASDDPINDRVDYYIEASGTNPATTVMSETTYGLSAVVGTGSDYARQDHSHGTPSALTPASSVTSETSFGISATVGTSTNYARQDHTHGSPANPVTAHEITYNHANLPTTDQKAALAGTSGTPSVTNKYVTNSDSRNSDARTPTSHGSGYHDSSVEATANKGAASGYCDLDVYGGVPTARLGTGTPSSSNFLRGDRTWSTILWSNVDKGSSNISDLASHSHTALDDIGTNTHATIDSAISSLSTHISATSGVHGCTSSATASKIIIRDSSGRAEVVAPTSTKEIANKGYCDSLSHLPAGASNYILYHNGSSWTTLSPPGSSNTYHLAINKGTLQWDIV